MPTGAYSYAPNAAAINALTAATTDVFTVEVSDGSLAASTTLTVNITGANDAPTITAETAPALVDTAALDVLGPVTGQLDGADVDAGAALDYRIAGETPDLAGDTVLAGLYGTLTVHADGSYSYAPNAAAINALTAATTDVFTVEVSDGSLAASTTLTVDITGANDAPTITAETAPALVDTAALDVLGPVTGQLDGADVDAGAALDYRMRARRPTWRATRFWRGSTAR